MEVRTINRAQLVRDAGTQIRVGGIHPENVDKLTEIYAEARTDGKTGYPFHHPLVVFTEDDRKYYLADGFTRDYVLGENRERTADCEVRRGGRREAWLWAVSKECPNANHGMGLTDADRRAAIRSMLADNETCNWSLRQIADHVGVSHQTVKRVKDAMDEAANSADDAEKHYLSVHAQQVELDCPELPESQPEKVVAFDNREPWEHVPEKDLARSQKCLRSIRRVHDTYKIGGDCHWLMFERTLKRMYGWLGMEW